MMESISMEKCKAFIDCQISDGKPLGEGNRVVSERPAITLSRQTGSGAHSIAEKLAAYLEAQEEGDHCPWTVFDKNLVEEILKDHHLPSRLAQYMPEGKISEIDDAVGELLGLHPSAWTLVEHTTETVLRLARMGNVILVGRGAPVIASKLKNTVHVRLVGTLTRRAEHTAELFKLSYKDALALVDRLDHQRKRYLKKYFKRDIDDPLLYHLIINTDVVSYDEAARMIGELVLRRRKPQESGLASVSCLRARPVMTEP
jgi:cytidylate kinase